MWNTQPQTALYSEPTATLLKKLFAAEWLRNEDNPFAAAREVESDTGKAIYIAQRWVDDPLVLEEKARLVGAMGKLARVPTKEDFAAELYKTAGECKTPTDKLNYFKFFAELMGYVEKGNGSGVNVNIMNQQKTMLVPVASSEDEWERLAQAHSRTLAERHG